MCLTPTFLVYHPWQKRESGFQRIAAIEKSVGSPKCLSEIYKKNLAHGDARIVIITIILGGFLLASTVQGWGYMTVCASPRVRGPRPGSEGFKLLEALVAMAVLITASLGILQLHGTIIRGIASSEDFSAALDVANQRLDELTIIGTEALPICAAGVNGPGCQFGIGSSQYRPQITTAPDGYLCTRFVDSTEVIMANGASLPATPNFDVTAPARFRVDTVVETHPDPGLYPEARMVTVSVCWTDAGNQVRQIQSRRYVVPEA